MAYESFPNDAHNNRTITLAEHEQIVSPLGLSGLLNYTSTPPLFGDSTGRHVKLRAGVRASLRGTRFNNTSETTIAIGANTSGKTRVDLVVLRLRREETDLGAGDHYTVAPHVIEGTPADQPVAPLPVRNDTPGAGFWDVPLGEVTVVHNASTITEAQVQVRAYFISGSGYAGRDAWAKPPVEPGVIFRANDVGITYMGTASGAWRLIEEDSGWVNVTIAAGWTTDPTGIAQVRRISGIVYPRIDLFRKGASISAGAVTVGSLPDGFKPGHLVLSAGTVNTAGGTCRFGIAKDGTIRIEYYSPIATGRAISMATPWPLD